MLKITSLQKQSNLTRRKIIQPDQQQSDFSIQCNIDSVDYLSIRQQSSNQQIKRKHHKKQNGQRINLFRIMKKELRSRVSSICFGEDGKKGIYDDVEIMNVERDEERIIRGLYVIGLGKECEKGLKSMLNSKRVRVIKINKLNEKVEAGINMQMLYKYYLQANKKEVKQAIVEGNIVKIIIKPFLSVYRKMEMETPVINVKYQDNHHQKTSKSISKFDIFKIFQIYQPKLLLTQQMKNLQSNRFKIYEQLYLKYENLPFYSPPQTPKHQLHQNKTADFEKVEDSLDQSQQNDKQSQETLSYPNIYDIHQQLKNLDDGNSERCGKAEQGNSEYKSEGKQRFEERFKKQVQILSDDVGNIFNL